MSTEEQLRAQIDALMVQLAAAREHIVYWKAEALRRRPWWARLLGR